MLPTEMQIAILLLRHIGLPQKTLASFQKRKGLMRVMIYLVTY